MREVGHRLAHAIGRRKTEHITRERKVGTGEHLGQRHRALHWHLDAHLRAGQEVRKRLEEKLLSSDPDAIIRSGRLDVRLDGMDAGTLSVVRVERRAPDQITLDEDQLRVMFKVEADLWQG